MLTSLKNEKLRTVVFLIILLGNYWVWRIISDDLLIALSVIASTAFLFINHTGKKLPISLMAAFLLTLFLQVKTNEPFSLTELTNDQQRLQVERLSYYPPTKITFFGKTLWIPLSHWFEERKESIAFFRILGNLSEVIDPNLYFFKNHPRERLGVEEYSKFPFPLIMFFWIGMLEYFAKEKRRKSTIVLLAGAILTFGVFGTRNNFGPFLLFPFIVYFLTVGVCTCLGQLKDKRNI